MISVCKIYHTTFHKPAFPGRAITQEKQFIQARAPSSKSLPQSMVIGNTCVRRIAQKAIPIHCLRAQPHRYYGCKTRKRHKRRIIIHKPSPMIISIVHILNSLTICCENIFDEVNQLQPDKGFINSVIIIECAWSTEKPSTFLIIIQFPHLSLYDLVFPDMPARIGIRHRIVADIAIGAERLRVIYRLSSELDINSILLDKI